MTSTLDDVLKWLRARNFYTKEGWEEISKVEIQKFPLQGLFYDHMLKLIRWMDQGKTICTVFSHSDNRDAEKCLSEDTQAALFASFISDSAVVRVPIDCNEWQPSLKSKQYVSQAIDFNTAHLLNKCYKLVDKGNLIFLMKEYYASSGGIGDPSWSIDESMNFSLYAPVRLDGQRWPKKSDDYNNYTMVVFGVIKIPMFYGIDADKMLNLMDDEPDALGRLRDISEETLIAISNDLNTDTINRYMKKLGRECREIERLYRELLKRRNNDVIGITIGTGLMALGLFLPHPTIEAIKPLIQIIGSTTFFSSTANAVNDINKFKTLPYYLLWKVQRL